VKVSLRTKIRYHGQDYASLDELPAAAREAYQKSSASGAVALNHILDKILLYGPRFNDGGKTRWLYDDVMSVVENNGRVTLPGSSEPFLTKRQTKIVVALVSALVVVGAIVAKAIA
jgi:hypothetical protein